jgi:hypothetical protein
MTTMLNGNNDIQRPPTATRHSSLESNDLLSEDDPPPSLTFTQLAHKILELHAFLTANLLVVRQILIWYDSFVNSSGEGYTMSTWYIANRRKKKGCGYRDLCEYEKLRRLGRAYIGEFRRINSGLFATVVGTVRSSLCAYRSVFVDSNSNAHPFLYSIVSQFGRACGDVFITSVGYRFEKCHEYALRTIILHFAVGFHHDLVEL